MFSYNLGLHMKDLKLLVSAIFLLKLVASSLEQNHERSVVSESFELHSITPVRCHD